MDVRNVFGFFGRGGETDLRRRGKVLKDFPPCGILRRTAAVALIDDDQVEEVARKLTVEFLALLGAGDRLIEGKVDFVLCIDASSLLVNRGGDLNLAAVFPLDGLRAGAELGHRSAERTKVVHHRLID